MKPANLVDTYLAHKGMRRVAGTGYDPILPFFMLDAMYQIMSKDIVPVESKQEQKLALKRWQMSYNAFNRDFFSAFDSDQQDKIIDIMDAFEAYINNDIIIAEVAVMDDLAKHNIPLDQQKVVASAMMCHVLTQAAHITWGAVYKNRYNVSKESPHIKAILKYSSMWMNMYFSKVSDAHIDPNDSQQICDAMDALCRKMVKFLKTIQ